MLSGENNTYVAICVSDDHHRSLSGINTANETPNNRVTLAISPKLHDRQNISVQNKEYNNNR